MASANHIERARGWFLLRNGQRKTLGKAQHCPHGTVQIFLPNFQFLHPLGESRPAHPSSRTNNPLLPTSEGKKFKVQSNQVYPKLEKTETLNFRNTQHF
jgi:hypothetical protein